jgi:aminotransferase
MTLQPNDRVAGVPESGIRKFFELAEERDDVISLGVGEPDFSTPWAARSAAIHSLEEGRTSYTSNRGMSDLRRLISDYSRRWDHDYDPDTEVLVTTGASEAVDLALRSFISPGDTVAIHQPNYISYRPGIQFAGGEPLGVPTHAADDFALTPEALAATGADEADLLVLCYPNNPTGAVMDEDEVAAVAEFCVDNDIDVIADEIYAALTYDGDHTSIASMPGMRERTVVINGFSKAYAMTGLRLGYMLAPADAIESLNRVHQYTMLSAPTTAQYAAIEALRSCGDAVTEMATEYNRRRRFVLSRFEEIGLDCFTSRGAFYAFPECGGDDEAFAEELLKEEGVAVVPGSVFGEVGEGHLRVSYATSMRELKTAMNRLERFCQSR